LKNRNVIQIAKKVTQVQKKKKRTPGLKVQKKKKIFLQREKKSKTKSQKERNEQGSKSKNPVRINSLTQIISLTKNVKQPA